MLRKEGVMWGFFFKRDHMRKEDNETLGSALNKLGLIILPPLVFNPYSIPNSPQINTQTAIFFFFFFGSRLKV